MSDNDFVIKNGVLKEYNGPGGVVTVPEGVTVISQNAFFFNENCGRITKLILPESLKEIWPIAFRCPGIRQLTIPKGVETIGDRAFAGCDNLEELSVVPENPTFQVVDGLLYTADGRTCLWCSPKKGGCVTIPDGVEELGSAFNECALVEYIKIPESVTILRDHAFTGCTSLTGVALPEGLHTIGEGAFQSCSNLREIVIPEGVEWLHYRTFADCAKLERVVLPASLRQIADKDHGMYGKGTPFYGCKALKEVVILGEKVEIDKKAFDKIWWADEARIVAPHLSISAFPAPAKLHAVLGFAQLYVKGQHLADPVRKDYLKYIRGQRKKLYHMALADPALLQVMLREKMIPQEELEELLSEAADQNIVEAKAQLLEYQNSNFKPKDSGKELMKQMKMLETGTLSAAEAKKTWRYEVRPEGGIRILGYKGKELHAVVPTGIGKETVLEIGSLAFSPDAKPLTAEVREIREKLRSVVIPASMTKIALDAFRSCASLESIQVEEGCPEYRAIDGLLYDRDGKTCLVCPMGKPGEVVLPGGITEIPPKLFYGCGHLTSVRLPDGVERLGAEVFCRCTALEEVPLPRSLTEIGDSAFEGCTALKTAVLPAGLVSVGKKAFLDCAGLQQLTIPASLKKIAPDAFLGTGALESIQVAPENKQCVCKNGILLLLKKKSIPLCAVRASDGIYAIPEGVTDIPPRLFKGHEDSMRELVIPEGVLEIKGSTCKGFTALKRVVFPNGLQKISAKAFAYCKNLEEIVWGHEEDLVIGQEAFTECNALSEVVFPEGLKQLDHCAFGFCSSLRRVVLPESLHKMEAHTFWYCSDLENITFLGTRKIELENVYADETLFEECKKVKMYVRGGGAMELAARFHIPYEVIK